MDLNNTLVLTFWSTSDFNNHKPHRLNPSQTQMGSFSYCTAAASQRRSRNTHRQTAPPWGRCGVPAIAAAGTPHPAALPPADYQVRDGDDVMRLGAQVYRWLNKQWQINAAFAARGGDPLRAGGYSTRLVTWRFSCGCGASAIRTRPRRQLLRPAGCPSWPSAGLPVARQSPGRR